MKVIIAVLVLFALGLKSDSVFSHGCSESTDHLLRLIEKEEALTWANSVYNAKLDAEYIERIQAKLDKGSKDTLRYFQLYPLLDRFHLLQVAFEKTNLNNVQIGNLFEIPLEQVVFWRDRPYRFENGKFIL